MELGSTNFLTVRSQLDIQLDLHPVGFFHIRGVDTSTQLRFA